MKVLLANSPFGGGGITTFATQLIECLSADTELTVVIGDDKKAPITDPRVKVIYRDTKLLTVENALFFINLVNNDIKPDAIIISAATIFPIIVPYLNDNVIVMTVSHSGRFFHTNYSALNHKYLDRIIAASSSYNKQYLEKRFHIRNKNKISVIYNFVDNDEEFEGLRYKKKNQKPFTIVYAGATSVHKSPELVAKIVKELLKTDLDFRFYWTGETTIPLTTNIFKHSKFEFVNQLLPKDPRLVFPGRIPNKKDYDLLLGSANVFLAPSKNEGCSMATLEALRSGSILVVADYENSNREIVELSNSGFVINHRDVDGFIKVIVDIINNPELYSQFYENSHKAFVNLGSYPVWKEKVFDVLKSPRAHKTRKKQVSKISIICDIYKMKWCQFESQVEQLFCFTIPSFISFRRQYRKFRNR